MSDTEMMNGILARAGVDAQAIPGTAMTGKLFCMVFEKLLDRLDEAEAELLHLKSLTPNS